MCRHLAYVGPAVPLATWLLDPPNSLVRQSLAPATPAARRGQRRRVRRRVVTPTGLAPVRHRAAVPVWADETFADLARGQRATRAPGRGAVGDSHGSLRGGVPRPFRSGAVAVQPQRRIDGWPDAAGPLARQLDTERLLRTGGA